MFRDPLVVPTDWLPKPTKEGFAVTFARATVPKANNIVRTAATSQTVFLILPVDPIFFPCFDFYRAPKIAPAYQSRDT